MFVAKTEIAPFEELRFDYGDEEVRRMFDELFSLDNAETEF